MVNKVHMIGTVDCDVEESHKIRNETFNKFIICIKRDSGVEDKLIVIYSDRVMSGELKKGDRVEIMGTVRSHMKISESGRKFDERYVFASYIEQVDAGDEEKQVDINNVRVAGKVLRCYKLRNTKSDRDILEFMLSVDRGYARTDYIKCLMWGRDARYFDKMIQSEGDEAIKEKYIIDICGRLQSRKYYTQDEKGNDVVKDMYELSAVDVDFLTIEEAIEKELISAPQGKGAGGENSEGSDGEKGKTFTVDDVLAGGNEQ